MMPNVIKFSRFTEFSNFNREFLNENPLLNYFIIKMIEEVFKGSVPLYKFFNITDDTGIHIAILFVENECLIYGNDATEETISLLAEELEFYKFKRHLFSGSKNVIDALFNKYKVVFSIQKHRNIYECKNINLNFSYSPGNLQMADMTRLDELTSMSVAFSESYYNEKQDPEESQGVVFSGIVNDNLYQWSNNGNICSIAQAMHNEYDFPVIGHVYTNPLFRNQGFAASIVHALTKGLIDAGNEICMLVTNASNPASNRAFVKVGYQKLDEYIRVYKEI